MVSEKWVFSSLQFHRGDSFVSVNFIIIWYHLSLIFPFDRFSKVCSTKITWVFYKQTKHFSNLNWKQCSSTWFLDKFWFNPNCSATFELVNDNERQATISTIWKEINGRRHGEDQNSNLSDDIWFFFRFKIWLGNTIIGCG